MKGRPFSDGFMETFFFIKDRDPPLKASRIVKMGFCLFLYVILTALSETSEKSTIQLFMSKSQYRTYFFQMRWKSNQIITPTFP